MATMDELHFLEPIKLGRLTLKNRLILAPLAGTTHLSYRKLMQEFGAGATVTELVSAEALIRNIERTDDMCQTTHSCDAKDGVQIFGANPDSMAKAATRVLSFNPSFLDINMGCPVRKVVEKGGGADLLQNLPQATEIVRKVRKAVGELPLSIKIRLGWDSNSYVFMDFIKMAYDEGVDFVSIHGRTRAQAYTGFADWEKIEEAASKSKIPIVGNGDLTTPAQISEKLKTTNCKAVMVGRGAMRDPYIFLRERPLKQQITPSQRFIELVNQYVEQDIAKLLFIKKQLSFFSHGIPNGSLYRQKLFSCETIEEAQALFHTFNSQKEIPI